MALCALFAPPLPVPPTPLVFTQCSVCNLGTIHLLKYAQKQEV